MKTFGEYLYEFVAEVLEEHPTYVLQGLSLSIPTDGVDYAISAEKATKGEGLAKILKEDLKTIENPDPSTLISIGLQMKSASSEATLCLRFCQSLDPEGEDGEDFEEEESCEKGSCCRKSCCSKDEFSEKMSKERDCAYRILIDLMEKMRSEDERKSSRKSRGYMTGSYGKYFF